MTLESIRNYYKVPAYRGRRVSVLGRGDGTITRGTAYVYIRIDGETFSRPYHPTDDVVTYDPEATQ